MQIHGTNPENDGQSVEKDEQELSYNDIMSALEKGDSQTLTRLMADEEEEGEPKQEVDEQEDEGNPDSEQDDSPNDDDSKQELKEEEKEPAASTDDAAVTKTDAERIAELERELHKARSDAGRVPYIQRRIQELERQVRAAQQPAAPKAADSVKTPQEIEIPAALKKRYDTIRETDPDLADTLEETYRMQVGFAHQASTLSVEEVRREQAEREDREFFLTEKAKLLSAVPQADTVFAMPEWKAWKESLSPGYRALAESGYADEVVLAIQAFAADYRAARGTDPLGQTAQQTQQPPVQKQPSEVEKARQRKVGAAAEVKPAAAKAVEDLDEEKLFAEIYNKLGKEQGLIK